MSAAGSEDPTIAVCIRCGQVFPARSRCPFCSDLRIVIREDSALEAGGHWLFELWQGNARVMILGGFATRADAWSQAHEFLRRYVAEKIAAGRY